MTNFKKSLESSILKERLNRLMESLEKTNTSKMIIERYYANICSIEIAEGTTTSKAVQQELTDLGLNESKIISTISSSVVPERKGKVADHFIIQKISLLESLCRELNPYSWMKSVSGFIAETADFMRENEMSILLERIIFDLENDKNSSYYQKAIETISEATIAENPISTILENAKDQKWIPLVGKLYEFCEKRRGNINGTNPNFTVSKIYSPVEFIEERGSYIFSVSGKIFETDGNTMMEYTNQPSNNFKSLLAITEKAKFDTGVMRLYPNSQSTLDINFNEEQPRVFLNSKLVEAKNIESALISGGHLRYTEKDKFAQIQQAIHEGNNVKELDFGYTVKSKLFNGVSVSVFSLNECVYVQKVNEGMKENTLVKAESAEDAISIVKDFMNYDISNSVKHLTEAEEARRVSKEKEISKKLDYLNSVYEKEVETIKNRVSFLKESLNDLDRVSRLNGIENTTKVLQAKALLESQIVKAEGDLSLQEMLIESATEKIKSATQLLDTQISEQTKALSKLDTSKTVNESSAEVKKVEDFLKKNGKYDKASDLYTWNDAGIEFDVTLGRDKVNLFDGEENTRVSYKEFIKSWMGESVNESCVPGKEYKIKGEAGWIYQGVADGKHIFNNEVGGKHPMNYDDAQFAAAHKSGEITECAY